MKKKLITVFLVVVTLLSCVFAFAACKSNDKEFKEIVSCAKDLEYKLKHQDRCQGFSITDNCGYKVVTGNNGKSGTYIIIPYTAKDLLADITIVDIAFFCNGELLGFKGDYPYSYDFSKKDRYLEALKIYVNQDFDKQYSANDLNKKI